MGASKSKNKDLYYNYENIKLETQKNMLDVKLVDVCVKASHNSYLSGNQFLSFATVQSLINCLNHGVRALELDLYSDRDTHIPFICHGDGNKDRNIVLSSKLDFEQAIKAISDSAFLFNNTDPLFIVIENCASWSEECNNKTADILVKYFGDKIFKKENILETKMSELVGKVLIIIDDVVGEKMKNTITYSWHYDDFKNFSSAPSSDADFLKNKDKFTRVYPTPSVEAILSFNFDPKKYKKMDVNLISINYQREDSNYLEYEKMFVIDSAKKQKSSFILK
jgi:hypothetical protein